MLTGSLVERWRDGLPAGGARGRQLLAWLRAGEAAQQVPMVRSLQPPDLEALLGEVADEAIRSLEGDDIDGGTGPGPEDRPRPWFTIVADGSSDPGLAAQLLMLRGLGEHAAGNLAPASVLYRQIADDPATTVPAPLRSLAATASAALLWQASVLAADQLAVDRSAGEVGGVPYDLLDAAEELARLEQGAAGPAAPPSSLVQDFALHRAGVLDGADPARALWLARRVDEATTGPAERTVLYRLARRQHWQGGHAACVATIRALHEIRPPTGATRRTEVMALWHAGRYPEARQLLVDLVTAEPAGPEHAVLLAMLLQGAADPEAGQRVADLQARGLLRIQAVDQPVGLAVRMVGGVMASTANLPPDELAAHMLAAIILDSGDVGLLAESAQTDPAQAAATRRLLGGAAPELRPPAAQAAYARAESHFQRGDLESAMVEYRAAIGADPYFALAYQHLGDCLYRVGQLPAAIAHLRQAIALNPTATAYRFLGDALRQVGGGTRVEAMACYQTAVAIDPGYGGALIALEWERALAGAAPPVPRPRPWDPLPQAGPIGT